jgi:phosphonate transport system substrate-binding protein
MADNPRKRKIRIEVLSFVAIAAASGFGAGLLFSGTPSSQVQGIDNKEPLSELVVAVVPQGDVSNFESKGEILEDYFASKIGMNVRLFYPTDDTTTIASIGAGTTHVAFMSSRPAQLAYELNEGKVFVFMAELRPFKAEGGTETLGTSYWSEYWVRADSDITALENTRGKNVAFSGPLSTGGYLFPVAKLVEEGMISSGSDPKEFFGNVVFSGGYQQSLMALLRGDVDVAAGDDWAVYTFLTPEEQSQIRVIERQGPVPTHSVIYRSDIVSPDLITKFEKAMIDIKTERPELLDAALFGANEFVPTNHHSHLGTLETALELSRIPAVS